MTLEGIRADFLAAEAYKRCAEGRTLSLRTRAECLKRADEAEAAGIARWREFCQFYCGACGCSLVHVAGDGASATLCPVCDADSLNMLTEEYWAA